MNVLFISNLFPDEKESYRGLDNAVVLHHLVASGKATVKSLALRPRLSLSLSGNKLELSPRARDAELHPEFHAIPYIPKVGGAFNARLAANYLTTVLQSTFSTYKPDVILTSWLFPDAAATVKACHRLGNQTPIVMIAQGSDVHRYLQSSTRCRQIIESIKSSNVCNVITRSRRLSELLAEAGAPTEKLRTIYNGIDQGVFHPPTIPRYPTPASPLYLTVGNLLPVKNQSMLIEALALLNISRKSKGQQPARLTIAGKGPLRTELENLAERLGEGSNVHLTGPLPAEQVADAMRSADYFCMSSLNEGFPNVLLEAMACSLPIISTDVGGIAELVRTYATGQLVPSENTEAMALAMETQFTTASLQQDANPAVKDWTAVAQDYALILNRAVNRPSKEGAD